MQQKRRAGASFCALPTPSDGRPAVDIICNPLPAGDLAVVSALGLEPRTYCPEVNEQLFIVNDLYGASVRFQLQIRRKSYGVGPQHIPRGLNIPSKSARNATGYSSSCPGCVAPNLR